MTLDFLVIGAEKSGTTWLADMLRQHPAIFIPEEKELFYFNRKFFESPELDNFNHDKPLAWYLSFFEAARSGQLKGEASPAYLWDEAAPAKIHAFEPGIKLIAILRDPVERAYSQYLYYVQRGVLGDIPFEAAARLRPDLLSRSAYAPQLRRYTTLFDPAQLEILFFDDIGRDSATFLLDVERFLGVAPFVPANLHERSNVTGEPRFRLLNRGMAWLRYAVRRHNPPFVLNVLRATGLAQLSEKLRLKNTRPLARKPALPPETERSLRAHFAADIADLETLTGRDLSAWR